MIGATPADANALSGSVEEWVDGLAGWATEYDVDNFIFWPASVEVEEVDVLNGEVAPAVRTEVERRRGAA